MGAKARREKHTFPLHCSLLMCNFSRKASLLRWLRRNLDGLVHRTNDVHTARPTVRREDDERVGGVPLGEDVALVRCGEDGVGVAGLEVEAKIWLSMRILEDLKVNGDLRWG